LREIQSGEFRNSYLIYNRKSTDEPDNQKNSLKYQRDENLRFANRAGLSLASLSLSGFCTDGVIAERHSGYKEDNDIAVTSAGMVQYRIARPKFKQLMQMLSRGYFKGVICLCWDRVSRNKADDAIIAKLMRAGVDVRFAFAQYDNTSAGALHMDIDGMFAAHHSRVTSEKVRLANHNMREQGLCTYKAPIGYLNPGKADHKPFDPERAPIVRQMFERYAAGDMSLADMARWANERGLTTQPMRRRRTIEEMLQDEGDEMTSPKVSRPVTKNHVHRILTNPFYIGQVIGNQGGYVKSTSHKALVTKKLFYAVQDRLGRKRVSVHYDEKLDLPFRGLVRCALCGRVYSPYRAKGILYLGVRCVPGCANKLKNCSLKSVEDKIGDLLSGLYLTKEEQSELDERASTDIALLEMKRHRELEGYERQKRKVREDLQYLRENKLSLLKTGAYDPEGMLVEENRLNAKLLKLQQKEQVSDASMVDLMKDVAKLSELLERAHSRYMSANSHQKEQYAKLVFSELTLSENALNYSLKNGFEALNERFVAVGCPTARISELPTLAEVREAIAELEGLLREV